MQWRQRCSGDACAIERPARCKRGLRSGRGRGSRIESWWLTFFCAFSTLLTGLVSMFLFSMLSFHCLRDRRLDLLKLPRKNDCCGRHSHPEYFELSASVVNSITTLRETHEYSSDRTDVLTQPWSLWNRTAHQALPLSSASKRSLNHVLL